MPELLRAFISRVTLHDTRSLSLAATSYAGMTNIPLDCTLLAKPNSERAPPLLLVGITTRRWLPQLHHAYFATFPYVQTTHHGIALVCPFMADNFAHLCAWWRRGITISQPSDCKSDALPLSYVPICINGKYFLSRATTVVFEPTVDYIAVLSLIRRQLAGVCGGTFTHKPFRTPRFGPGRV